MIATGIEEGVPTRRAGQGPGSWQEVHTIFRGLVEGVSRTATREELETAADALSVFADDILKLLETQVKTTNTSANEPPNERHKQNSKPNPQLNLNLAFEKAGRRGRSQILKRLQQRKGPIRLEWC